jgi:hypothetical protein
MHRQRRRLCRNQDCRWHRSRQRKTTAAFTDMQIPRWNLGERIPIAPQVWDVDRPQVDVRAAEVDVDIINLDSEITPVAPETVKKSPIEKRKKNGGDRRNRRPMADWSYGSRQ